MQDERRYRASAPTAALSLLATASALVGRHADDVTVTYHDHVPAVHDDGQDARINSHNIHSSLKIILDDDAAAFNLV